MCLLRKSKYAFFVKKDNGNYIAYSSLSGAVIHLKESKYIEMLESVLNKDLFSYEDTDFFNLMTSKKFLYMIILTKNC